MQKQLKANRLELLIPPPLVAITTAILMYLCARQLHIFSAFHVNRTIIYFLILSGLVLAIIGVFQFRRASTTIHPNNPHHTQVLVTNGVYRFTRNPMYLGLTLILCAWGLYLGSLLALTLIVLFMWYINRFQIKPEERALQDKFGETYAHYRASVRKWL